jgi:hypothetical protein
MLKITENSTREARMTHLVPFYIMMLIVKDDDGFNVVFNIT